MKNKPVFSFETDADLQVGIERLRPVLGFEFGDGITVTAEKGDRLGVTLKDGKATVYYTKKHLFFRELGILCEHAAEQEFEIFEDTFFDQLSVMIDASRCAVQTVSSIKSALDYLALMGYGMAMMYTEDTVELPSRPYFGYMRGRYTADELRAMDDYAYEYGIEMIPCIECYGHMGKYLNWSEAAAIKDTAEVLLAREEKTFEFLDELIGTVSSCYRSKRIHIGMDEAWDMGRGKFLDKHGYVPPIEIFTEYMERLIGITDKYGLTPMMWSDMYFRASSKKNAYYEEGIEIKPEIAAQIPKNIELVFWHYGEGSDCNDYMLKKHVELGRKTLFAGGLWSWIGHFPEHNYAMSATRLALEACRKNGVREVMMTVWLNDNAECDLFANLFGLSFFAEFCFNRDASDDKLRSRFEAISSGSYDAFYAMSLYHNRFENGEEYPKYHDRFAGKPLFWQDIMEGMYEPNLFKNPMSDHYTACAERMKQYQSDRWQYLYDLAYRCFDYLAIKTYIAENLQPAYKNGDREMLNKIANTLLPQLKKNTAAVHEAHKTAWLHTNKVVGWSNMDIRYGGVVARCDTAIMLINRYLDGKDKTIEELEVTRLPRAYHGFTRYTRNASPNSTI